MMTDSDGRELQDTRDEKELELLSKICQNPIHNGHKWQADLKAHTVLFAASKHSNLKDFVISFHWT